MAEDRKWYKWFYDNIHSRQYDVLIRWFLWPFGGEKRFREEMMQPVELTTGDRILDLCCGTGNSTLAVRERAGDQAEIVGVDLSSGQIRVARKKNRFSNVRFVEADAARTGLEGSYFDKVFIAHALHEMPRAIRLNVLKEARRLLTEGGRLFIFELDNPDSLGRRLLLGLWLGYWVPWPINFENRTRRDMLRCGVADEVKEVGFRKVQKLSKFQETMQVVIGEK